MIIKFQPGDKVQALTPTIIGWKGVGIVLSLDKVPNRGAIPGTEFDIITIAMMDGPYIGKKAQFLPEELTIA